MIYPAKNGLYLLCFAASTSFGMLSTAHAATLVSEGHAAGAQCAASDINNSGTTVGTCSPGNATGPSTPWVATTLGTEMLLPPLVSGQACDAGGVTNGGVITGGCKNGGNNSFAVTWSASAPTNPPVVLNPLSGLLGLPLGADVSSGTTGYSQTGAVVGESISSAGNSTAVLWPAGSASALPVSSSYDNCAATDVNDTLVDGKPSVALNCPNGNGTVTAKIAQYTVLAGYVATALPLPSGYNYCSVAGINNTLQAVGTCHTPAPDLPKTALWSTPTSVPTLLTTVPGNPRNGAQFINNLGHVVFAYQTTNGQSNSGFWNPVTNVVTLISPLSGGTQASAAALADNDTVLINSDISTENVEAAEWTLTGGTVAVGFEGGGRASALGAISQNGQYAAGGADNSGHNFDAVETSLP